MLIPGQYNTTPPDRLKTEVENKTTYTLSRCELNIYETHRKVENIRLSFDGFTVTSMLRGKKVLHNNDNQLLNYLPGESFILQRDTEMVIDFPEANHFNPTQCTALVIDNAYLSQHIQYLNEQFPKDVPLDKEWKMNLNNPLLQNDENIAGLCARLIRIFSGTDPLKDILVDIKLKELVVSILRLENLNQLTAESFNGPHGNERFKAVIEYIRRNIGSNFNTSELSKMACMSKSVFYRAFTHEFGIPPNKLILTEKIKYAKTLLASGNIKIKEACFAAGFSDPNYFSRIFRKIEGISPMEYLSSIQHRLEHN